jgi:glycosyltransferase involved in cell wall biosynthesis
MPDTLLQAPPVSSPRTTPGRCRVVVIWIDWYAYHIARFLGLANNPDLAGTVAGVEMVGGIGVHTGLRFREELPPDLPVETLFPGQNWADAGQWRLAKALWRRLDALDPEVVLVPGYYTLPSIAAAVWARAHRRKSVLMTESTQDDHRRSALKEMAKSLLVRTLFNWAVAGGSRHVSYLAALGFPSGRVARFYDVVDNEGLYQRAQQLRREAGPMAPAPCFLYVGRLAQEKNLTRLLDAYIAHRADGGSWPLILAGDGPERVALTAQAARSPFAADIHFTGHQSSAELPRHYAFAGCLVLPSSREPWGLVVNEAMACGLPVLVSKQCGCADDLVADGVNGFVFDPFRSAELIASLAAMEGLNRQQWLLMSAQSLERIAGYSPRHFGEQIAAIAGTSP